MAARNPENVVNFAPGPAKIPAEVRKRVQDGIHSINGTGVGILETSHRSSQYAAINKETSDKLCQLLNIPSNYKVLFMHGGGTGQFSAVPLNLLKGDNPTADYLVTGTWSNKAAKEAEKYCKVNKVLPKMDKYTGVPPQSEWKLNPDASYVYYCENETVHGVEFHYVPETGSVPLVCDMSSNFLSHEVDVSRYGLIYAGAQKNVGCAGVTIVIVREDLLNRTDPKCPVILDYKQIASLDSIYNTPCTVAVYVLGLVLDWIIAQGGVKAMQSNSLTKSGMLYDVIDQSDDYYSCPVEEKYRSRMNVTLRVGGPNGDKSLEEKFVEEASLRGMLSLKGHRSVGGLRASLYNAITVEETRQLKDFMLEFMRANKKED